MENQLICKKCKIERDREMFFSIKGKVLKMCKLCRNREACYRDNKETSIFDPNKRKFNIRAKVDKLKLNYLINKYKEGVIEDLGGSFIQNKIVSGEGQLSLLSDFYNDLDEQGEMTSSYSQRCGIGRYYIKRKLGLQNLSRKIRHTICDELMYDIDMKNAHPVLLQHYCVSNNINCDHLTYYINNRVSCFESLKDWKGLCRDEAKRDTLAILNGRMKSEKQVINAPEWYINYYDNIRDIMESVKKLNPKIYERARKSKEQFGKNTHNVIGTMMSYIMGDLENKALMHTYDLLTKLNIEIAELCYDGLLIYKKSVGKPISTILKMCQENLKEKMGVDMIFTQKDMNEGFIIDNEVEAYTPKDIPIETHSEARENFRLYETDYVKITTVNDRTKFVQDIQENHCVAIKAPMGRGKTTSITRYINDKKPKRIRVLSPRQSYANSITTEYNEKTEGGFKSYLNVEKKQYIATDRLVMSMESLHYMSIQSIIDNPFDLLILDECQANLASHTTIETNGKENLKDNIAVLNMLLRTSKKIILADAFLNCKTINFLTNMEIPTTIYNYQVKMDARNAIEIISEDLDSLYYEIDNELSIDKKPYVIVSSKSRLDKWATKLREKHPNKNILTYTSGQGKNIQDVRKEWKIADCVLTTTTITVGINYDIKDDFDKVFISASARAKNAVVNLFQAHYRVRYLKDNQLIFHLYDQPIDRPTTNKEKVATDLETKEKLLLGTSDFFIKASQAIKQLVIDNTHEHNLSVSEMSTMFYLFLKECNYSYEKKTLDSEEEEDWEIEPDITLPPFKDIPIINADEYKKLNEMKRNGEGLSQEDKFKVDKYIFLKTFTEGDIDKWVSNSYDESFWQTWVNFKRIKIRNIKTEKKVRTGYTNLEKLITIEAEQCDIAIMNNTKILQTGKVIEMCRDLGLDISSQHIGKEIEMDKMNKLILNISNNAVKYRELFNIKDRRKDKSKMNDVNCISLINTVFKNYGFTKFKVKRRVWIKTGKDKKQVSIYTLVDHTLDISKDVKIHPENWVSLGERVYNSINLINDERIKRLRRCKNVDIQDLICR